MPQVVKTDGSRADFDRDKLRTGFMRALHKRPVPTELVDEAIDRDHAGHAVAGRARDRVAAPRRDGDARAAQARQGRLHPLRLGVRRASRASTISARRSRKSSARASASDANASSEWLNRLAIHDLRLDHSPLATHAFHDSADDQRYMARALRARRARPVHDHAQSARRLRHRARRRGGRRGLAREGRRAACGGRMALAQPRARGRAARRPTCRSSRAATTGARRRASSADRGRRRARGRGDADPNPEGRRHGGSHACARAGIEVESG